VIGCLAWTLARAYPNVYSLPPKGSVHMTRVSNFNAGPAALPLPVLERAQAELLDFEGTGMSIMEHSHRGKAYEGVHDEAIALLTELAGIPPTHQVLFMQGGASMQFAQVPMNFLHGKSADYLHTGTWSKLAMDEARLYGTPRIAATTEADKFMRVPRAEEMDLDPAAAYVHVTSNNTIEGTQYHYDPDTKGVPLIADMSSDFLWKKPDIGKYALIYAGAQKNLGPSGVVVVVARKDFIESGSKDIPKIFKYTTAAAANSLYNTPPTFAIYLVRNVLAWIKASGGVEQVHAWNTEKARILYGAIDANPEFFRAPVEKASRSTMNVVFRLATEALEDEFVKTATKAGLVGLKGHRSVGGIRASTYNAVTVEDVKKLVAFMEEFARKH
jgi:phosphoserine aminotransferase